ncbi:MAG: helical backbone metal receptor [Lautropia sp.]|nr:helical backbone metal receptor [Lautropia sp.]
MLSLVWMVVLAGWPVEALAGTGAMTPPASRVSDPQALGGAEDTAVAEAVVVQDDAGRSVRLVPAQLKRIVSLSPALTEMVCVLGACERLVGVDRHSNWPASVKTLPKLGGLGSIGIEGLLAQRPDLVLMGHDEALLQALRRLRVPVLVLAPTRLADVAGTMQRLGLVLALPPARAAGVWQDIETQLQKLAESLPEQARGWRVHAEVDPAPYLAGPASFMGEVLARLGLGNVVADTRRPFVQRSREWVLQADPDVLVVGDPQGGGLAALSARPGWANLRAVHLGRICLFAGEALDTLVRPGPRLAEGARQVHDCVRRVLSTPPVTDTNRE